MKTCIISALPPLQSGVALYTLGLMSGLLEIEISFPIVIVANKLAKSEIHVQNLRVRRSWTRGLRYFFQVLQAIIREIYEETGLSIREPKLCGVKQFQTDEDERYIVLLFKTDKFEGTLTSSDEGEMRWIDRNSLKDYTLVNDFMELLKVFDSDYYSEFMYERNISGDDWLIRLY